MSHLLQRVYCERIKSKLFYFFENKKVLDVGSLDINGSNRYLFTNCDYLGIDVGEGSNVDFVCVAHEFEAPDNYYDTIITTEMLEHDMHYEKSIKNIIRMLKPGGLFIFTCASTGREEHGTRRSDGSFAAPLLVARGDWGDYYKNLIENDFRIIDGFNFTFPDGVFEYNDKNFDLYFYGIKNGNKMLKYII